MVVVGPDSGWWLVVVTVTGSLAVTVGSRCYSFLSSRGGWLWLTIVVVRGNR